MQKEGCAQYHVWLKTIGDIRIDLLPHAYHHLMIGFDTFPIQNCLPIELGKVVGKSITLKR